MNNLWYKNIQLGDIKSVNLDLNQTNILDFNSGDQFIKTCTNNQSFIIVNPQPKNFRLILTGGGLSNTLFRTSSKSTITIRGIESIAYYDASSINILTASILEVREGSITMLISIKPASIVGDIDVEARDRLTNLENNNTIYEVFKSFSTPTATGTVYIPAEATIFNLYNDGISDAIVVKADSNGNPTEELVLNSSNVVVTVSSFTEATGEFTLSSAPAVNYCLVYYIKIADEYKSNVDETKIVSESYVPVINEYWRDIDFPILIRTTGVGIPTLTTFNGNLTMPAWAVNDFNQCESQEFVHEWKEGSTCYWHLHLTTNGLDVDNRYVRVELEYAYSSSGTWTFPAVFTSADILIPANTPSKTQIIIPITSFTPTGSKIGDHCIARLKRVAATGTAPSNNCWIPMLQMHIICDSLGSRSIATK